VSIEFASISSIAIGLFLLTSVQASAQPLVRSSPTGTLSDGANISINPQEPLPANGTVSISTEGATDTDMNVLPPEGVSVIISNDTVTITNQIVDIATAEENEEDGDDTGDEEEEPGDETEGVGPEQE
jgi:hypothetical protein